MEPDPGSTGVGKAINKQAYLTGRIFSGYGLVIYTVMMTITLNGQQKNVPEGITVRGLLEHLHIQPERVAVELNLDVIRKKDYESTRVQSGDAVEVVSFMGGGMGQSECNVPNQR